MSREEAWETVGKGVAASIVNWTSYWWTRRKVLKLGGPPWAAYGFARVTMLLASDATAKGLGIDKEQAEEAVRVLLDRQPKEAAK